MTRPFQTTLYFIPEFPCRTCRGLPALDRGSWCWFPSAWCLVVRLPISRRLLRQCWALDFPGGDRACGGDGPTVRTCLARGPHPQYPGGPTRAVDSRSAPGSAPCLANDADHHRPAPVAAGVGPSSRQWDEQRGGGMQRVGPSSRRRCPSAVFGSLNATRGQPQLKLIDAGPLWTAGAAETVPMVTSASAVPRVLPACCAIYQPLLSMNRLLYPRPPTNGFYLHRPRPE